MQIFSLHDHSIRYQLYILIILCLHSMHSFSIQKVHLAIFTPFLPVNLLSMTFVKIMMDNELPTYMYFLGKWNGKQGNWSGLMQNLRMFKNNNLQNKQFYWLKDSLQHHFIWLLYFPHLDISRSMPSYTLYLLDHSRSEKAWKEMVLYTRALH